MGALGPVFRTYEPTRDRLVAVKVFRLDITPEQAQNLAEALAVAADAGLFHPSIVEPIAAGVEGTVAYRAEEYVAAESLDVALRHYAPAAMSRVLPFMAQLAGAVDFARTAGVGHGALHPRDIFVTPDEARATGFGVVEALERVGLRAPVRRPYSAPERVAGEPWSTPADVFSLAAIAYELLTGRRPSGTGAQIGSLSGTAVGRDSMDLVHAVLARAMHEQPAQRYASALEFASALDAASQGRQPAASSPAAAVPVAAAASRATPAPMVTAPASGAESDEIAERAADDTDTADEDDFDDVDDERDADELMASSLAEEPTEAAAPGHRTLFDDENEEAIEDLALDPREAAASDRFTDEFIAAASAFESAELARSSVPDPEQEPADRYLGVAAAAPATRDVRESYEESRPDPDSRDEVLPPHRTGPSWPAALVLVGLALLVGFVAGQMIETTGPANPTPAPAATDVAAKPPSEPPAQVAPPAASIAESPARLPSTPTPQPAPATEPAPPTSPVASPPAPPAVRTGTISVRSSPSGASVTVDGKWRGRTPLTLDDVAFGTREVRVVQEGYAIASEDVALSSSAPARSLSFRLRRTPAAPPAERSAAAPKPTAPKPGTSKPAAPVRQQGFTGGIYVDSLPRGASVFINGRAVGTTPVLVPEVPVGSQIVRLQLEEHRTWSTTARVVAGQQIKVSGSLERIR